MSGEMEGGLAVDEVAPVAPEVAQEAAMEVDGAAEAATPAATSVKAAEFAGAIDLGADTSVVARVSTRSLKSDILRNDLSNQKTPMVISFAAGHRSFGEVAVQLKTTNKDCSVEDLLRFVDYAARTPEQRQQMDFDPLVGSFEDHEVHGKVFRAQVGEGELEARAEQLLAMVLGKLGSFAREEGNNIPLSIIVPDSFEQPQLDAVRDAAALSGLDVRQLVTRTEAAAMDYGTKRSAEALGESAVLIVDVGHAYTSAAVYEWAGKKGSCVASACMEGVGGGAVDRALYEALCADCDKRKGVQVQRGSKGSIRLMTQVRKLKESLSAVPESSVTCESLANDEDVTFVFTRDALDQVCAPLRERISALVKDVLERCPEEVRAKLTACELIGGGMRVPLIRQAIDEACGDGVSLGYTMDSMAAVAVGGALCCASLFRPTGGGVMRPAYDNLADFAIGAAGPAIAPEELAELRAGRLAELVQVERALEEQDARAAALHSARNRLEAKVFEFRGLAESSRPHVELMDKAGVLAVVSAVDEWLYDDADGGGASAGANLELFQSKLAELEKGLEPLTSAYFAKLAEERAQQEKEMDEEAARAAAELEAQGGKEDHDARRLRKPERMRKVVLNKEEGSTLFKDGNYDAALLRYIRALQHCEKFFDLSPEDVKEVGEVRLALHLNCAQCGIKLQKWDECVKHAKQALELDADSTKALYRLAFAQENLKAFAEAKKNLERAAELEPEDKAIQRLMQRVEAQIKREKLKAKKMAQKMFG